MSGWLRSRSADVLALTVLALLTLPPRVLDLGADPLNLEPGVLWARGHESGASLSR